MLGCRKYPYLPEKYLEVISFEVKPCNALDITAVYEAIAHRRAATHSYVLVVRAKNQGGFDKKVLVPLVNEAKRFGIGLVTAEDPGKFEKWNILLDAERFDPPPAQLNAFIATQMTREAREKIVTWF